VGGGSASMPGFLEYMAAEISLPVIVADPWAGVIYPKDVQHVSKYDAPMYTTALGLARMEGHL
jgi:Tfp pilus assembly PilM family ATPase